MPSLTRGQSSGYDVAAMDSASTPMPVSAAGSTESAGSHTDDPRSRTFPCEGCGAHLTFDVGVQSLKCSYCGFVKPLDFEANAPVSEQDFRAMLDRQVDLRSRGRQDEPALHEVGCSSCGATVQFTGTLTSTECAYCGIPLQRDGAYVAPDRVPVDGVLPFHIDRASARTNLKKWVVSRWFAPNEFKARGIQGRFNGVYLPFWTFDTLTAVRYTGQRGEHYWVTVGSGKNKRREMRTRWYPASGAFRRFFDDVLVIAAKGMPRKRIRALEPWPLNGCVSFNPQILAGFVARTYDIPLDAGFADAKTRIAEAIHEEVEQRIGGDTQRVHSIDTLFGAITYKHLLLPIWMLAYRYRDKSYQVVVNAGTGEVQGDRPYSWIKILLAVLAGLTVAGGLAFLFSLAR